MLTWQLAWKEACYYTGFQNPVENQQFNKAKMTAMNQNFTFCAIA